MVSKKYNIYCSAICKQALNAVSVCHCTNMKVGKRKVVKNSSAECHISGSCTQ